MLRLIGEARQVVSGSYQRRLAKLARLLVPRAGLAPLCRSHADRGRLRHRLRERQSDAVARHVPAGQNELRRDVTRAARCISLGRLSPHGRELDEGWEASLADVQRVAVEAQKLWSHRCEAKKKCRCARSQR